LALGFLAIQRVHVAVAIDAITTRTGSTHMNANLTETQKSLLIAAAEHPDHRLEWFPEGLRGGARTKVLASLESKGLIDRHEEHLILTPAGFTALGLPVPSQPSDDEPPTAPSNESASDTHGQRRTRDHTKQATVIQLLQRPQGATLEQLVEATGWMKHSVRGCLAGALKKKLGLTITSDKVAGGERVYYVR